MKLKKLTDTQARWSHYYNKNEPPIRQVRWFDVDLETGETTFQFWVNEKDPVEDIRFLCAVNPERWP